MSNTEKEAVRDLCLGKHPRRPVWTLDPDRRAPLEMITTLAELVAAVLGCYAAWLAIRAHRNRRR